MKGPEGIVLPMTSTTLFWTPEVASDYIKLFLPVLYNFSPDVAQTDDAWSPFINPDLLKKYRDRYKLNQKIIESEDLRQTIGIYNVTYNSGTDSANVQAELRIINKYGELTRTPMKLHVKFANATNPLNAYGHNIDSLLDL